MGAGNVVARRLAHVVLAWFLALGVLLPLTGVADAATFSNPAPITIPSQGIATPYPSSITVSGLVGTTMDVNVTLNNLGHTFPSDVAIALVPPGGTSVLLMDAAGTASTSGANLTFDDSAPSFLPASGPLTSGSFKPTANASSLPSFGAPGPGTSYCNPGPSMRGTPCTAPGGGDALAGALNGFDPNGTWSLYVMDRFSGDAGQITGGWTLSIAAGGGPQRTLAVAKAGSGDGTVTSSPAGINCGGDCAEAYADGTSVVLTAAPAANSNLASWTGCDSTTATTCTVAINAVRNVTATFNLNPPQSFTVSKNGTASEAGTVTSVPAGISCGGTCAAMYPGGSTVVITENAPVGSAFGGFTGCDTTTATACTVNLTGARNVTATFTTVPTHRLSVATNGTGRGRVVGPGVACGADCSELYNDGTSVLLTANPTIPGSRFTGWTGCDSPVGSTCTMSLSTDKTVTATFTQGPPTDLTGGGTATGLLPDTSPPVLTAIAVTNPTFAVAAEPTPTLGFAAARRHKHATIFQYTLSEQATVSIVLTRRRSGRRRDRSCVAPTRKLRKAMKCVRLGPRGRLTRKSARGANAVYFSGRVGSKALRPGSYQATLSATDGAGNTSKAETTFFKIVER